MQMLRLTPASSGHDVRLRLLSNLTSFGCGMCVSEPGGEYVHIPIAFPLRTGLWAVSWLVAVCAANFY